MAVPQNLTVTTDFTISPRAIDFVTRFSSKWKALTEVIGISRPIKKALGTKLTSVVADVTLANPMTTEGEETPYSKAKVRPVAYSDLTIERYKTGVTIQDVEKFGPEAAIHKVDEAFLNKLQGVVMNRFYTFMQTGTLTATAANLQAAVAKGIGSVKAKFEDMDKDAGNVVVFVNVEDAYEYLGVAPLSVQNEFGINYLKNFIGASTMILTAKIPRNTVIAIPADNMVLYYIDPSDNGFAEMDLHYTVEGETNLIGIAVKGNYDRGLSDVHALMGMALWAEYLDGIAVVTISAGAA